MPAIITLLGGTVGGYITFAGAHRLIDLEYKEYEPLWECTREAAAKQKKKAHFVVCDSYVTMSDGTGIVHIAPAFGEDDNRVGRDYNLPFVQFVDGQGNMAKETPYAGVFVKKADRSEQTRTQRMRLPAQRRQESLLHNNCGLKENLHKMAV